MGVDEGNILLIVTGVERCLKKNLKASRPSEHPSVRGKFLVFKKNLNAPSMLLFRTPLG